jgi:hypothetical protein
VPWARILVFALALTHSVGIADLIIEDVCGESCDDSDCGDDCIPGVACRCHCTSTVAILGARTPVVATIAPPMSKADFVAFRDAHDSPDPREILHVPRRAS